MPAKRPKARQDFSLLSTDRITEEEVKGDSEEGNVNCVMRASDAPTSSKFYTDAQTYFSDLERQWHIN